MLYVLLFCTLSPCIELTPFEQNFINTQQIYLGIMR